MNTTFRAMELLEQHLREVLVEDMEPGDVYFAAVRAIRQLLEEKYDDQRNPHDQT
ncbi:hypothetical protein [Xanthomonas phage XPV1]|uniref:Uncharacterized protein n=1 Tax=Xanthomonas phage XPV1 TaxID=2099860 RepID=A0A3S7I6D8_9CAUD|nr:hypothetical protein KEM12_gp50 [Xanthomonas phage XPV1]AVO24214.1 hypothetical protein [Xanthomonas phage XPV1]